MNRSLLLKATSSDDSPTPGYLYGEIAKMTHQGMEITEKIVKFLIDKIQQNTAVVKLKVLQVIKHVCRKGHMTFRRMIHSPGNIGHVKSCLQFSGPAHPLKGDQPNRAVRDAAKEALEAIFDDSTEVTPNDSALKQRIQGYGANGMGQAPPPAAPEPAGYYNSGYSGGGRALPSETGGYRPSPYSGGGGGGGGMVSSGGRFQGIGNPNFRDPRNEPKGFLDRVKDRVEEYSDIASKSVASTSIQGWLGTTNKGGGGGSGAPGFNYASNRGPNAYTGGSYQGAQMPGGHSGSSPALSSYSSPASSSQFNSSGPMTQQWGQPAATQPAQQQTSAKPAFGRTGGGGTSDGKYERGLVDEVCSRGGVRAVPAREKLNRFLEACKTLDAQTVMPIVYEKLDTNDWKVQHKALCVCEAFLEGGDCYESYVDYLDENADILEDLQSCTQPTLKNRLKKVWVLLYGEDMASAEASTVSETALPTQDDTNLLDFGAPAPSATEQPKTAAQDMFGDVQVKAPVAEPEAPTEAAGIFTSLKVKSLSETNNGSAQNNGSSEDLLFGGETTTLEAPSTVPTQSSNNIVDQLSSLSFSSDTQPTKPDGGATGFSFLQSSTPPAAPAPQVNSDNVGSAFDALMQSNIAHRQNPIPTQPNAYLPRPHGFQQPHDPQLHHQPNLREMQGGMGNIYHGQQQQMYAQQQQFPGHMRSLSSMSSSSSPVPLSKAQSPKDLKQPDKFDFVSSAMAEMK